MTLQTFSISHLWSPIVNPNQPTKNWSFSLKMEFDQTFSMATKLILTPTTLHVLTKSWIYFPITVFVLICMPILLQQHMKASNPWQLEPQTVWLNCQIALVIVIHWELIIGLSKLQISSGISWFIDFHWTRIYFIGDDVWTSLYNSSFQKRFEIHDSFNIYEFDETNNVQLFFDLLENKTDDWDVLITHFLELDHYGHQYSTSQPNHFKVENALEKLNSIIIRTVSHLPADTLFLILGDHGLTLQGSHGGGSVDERKTALCGFTTKSKMIRKANVFVIRLNWVEIEKRIYDARRCKYDYLLVQVVSIIFFCFQTHSTTDSIINGCIRGSIEIFGIHYEVPSRSVFNYSHEDQGFSTTWEATGGLQTTSFERVFIQETKVYCETRDGVIDCTQSTHFWFPWIWCCNHCVVCCCFCQILFLSFAFSLWVWHGGDVVFFCRLLYLYEYIVGLLWMVLYSFVFISCFYDSCDFMYASCGFKFSFLFSVAVD